MSDVLVNDVINLIKFNVFHIETQKVIYNRHTFEFLLSQKIQHDQAMIDLYNQLF